MKATIWRKELKETDGRLLTVRKGQVYQCDEIEKITINLVADESFKTERVKLYEFTMTAIDGEQITTQGHSYKIED